jgi:L-seryl-tRNA(Ser) seleniumtransferase
MIDPRRTLPGVDALLASTEFQPILADHPRTRVVRAIREVLRAVREELGDGNREVREYGLPAYAARTGKLLEVWARASLRPVINATGVVLHTNLGRAPLSSAAREAMARAGSGYSNLEFDLASGTRGSRYVHCVDLLKEITGAPDALVVNNNAAAVVLALSTMAHGREVLVSRGELVEIGGGFRIPDMISRSGGILKEVGTTNRTRLADYRQAAGEGKVSAILKVHRSNFRMTGFTEEASLEELADLARGKGLFLFHDLGSGLLVDPDRLGLPEEPRAPDSLRKGAHAVAISGDKLLGGPQAGILLGTTEVMAEMRMNPLTRAFRVDKVTLAGLEATLEHYLDPEEAPREIPALRTISYPPELLEKRTRALAGALTGFGLEPSVAKGSGLVGGGTYPGVELPGCVLTVRCAGLPPQEVARRLRMREPPVVGRVEGDHLVLNLRTVDPSDDAALASALRAVSSPSESSGPVPSGSDLPDPGE